MDAFVHLYNKLHASQPTKISMSKKTQSTIKNILSYYCHISTCHIMYVKSKQPPYMSTSLAATCCGLDPTCKKETTPLKKQATTGCSGQWVLFLHLLWENCQQHGLQLVHTLDDNLCWALGPVDFPHRAGLLVSFSEFLVPYQISTSLGESHVAEPSVPT